MKKKRTNQTSIDNIFYYQEISQDILNLTLENTFEEIGFFSIFKAAYFFHKGKIPTNKLLQYCRVFDKQKEFENYVKNNCEIKGNFYQSKELDNQIKLIEEKSKKRRDAVKLRGKQDTNDGTIVPTNDGTNGGTKQETINNKHKTLNIKQETLDNKHIYQELADGLKFILEEKLKRKIKATNWKEDIRLLIENDLKPRSNAIDDVKKAIQAVSDHYGKEYFPVIQSASSLRNKISSIENYLAKNKKTNEGINSSIYNNILSKIENE